MRLILGLLLAAAAALAPTATAAPDCRGGTTVKSTDRYRVYAHQGLYLACLRSSGRVTELYEVDSNDDFGQLRVAGRYVAVVAGSCSSSGCDYWIVLGDMRRGVSRTVAEDGGRLVLRATGSLAYATADEAGTWASIQLVRWGREGTRTLASGSDVDPASLRREGIRAVWREGGVLRSARLP